MKTKPSPRGSLSHGTGWHSRVRAEYCGLTVTVCEVRNRGRCQWFNEQWQAWSCTCHYPATKTRLQLQRQLAPRKGSWRLRLTAEAQLAHQLGPRCLGSGMGA